MSFLLPRSDKQTLRQTAQSSTKMSLFGGNTSFGQSSLFGQNVTANSNPMKDFEVSHALLFEFF